MGNFVSSVGDRATVISAPGLWLEGAAIQQLVNTSKLPGMAAAVGMPDLHPGRGYPIGASFLTEGCFYPALVGSDIGCGVSVWTTSLSPSRYKAEKLDRLIGNLDSPIGEEEMSRLIAFDPSVASRLAGVKSSIRNAGITEKFDSSYGTIGAGNHFLELQRLEEVYADIDDPLANPRTLNLVIHSGSRGLGEWVLRSHVDAHGHAAVVEGSELAALYIAHHTAAVKYAVLNRHLIALRVLVRLSAGADKMIDINHNTVTNESIGSLKGWVHRKGATPMSEGRVLIPGSRDHFSYLVSPNGGAAGLSLSSLAHGAGRKWQRADCKAKLKKPGKQYDFSKGALGSRIICNDKDLGYQEAGAAYKPIDTVIDSLKGAGLIDVLASYRPVLTYKTRGECC